jgi:hypothetical protein
VGFIGLRTWLTTCITGSEEHTFSTGASATEELKGPELGIEP